MAKKAVKMYHDEVEEERKVPSADKKVPVGDLAVMQLFNFEGGVYSKRKTGPAGVKALSIKGDELITLDPDTPVSPVK